MCMRGFGGLCAPDCGVLWRPEGAGGTRAADPGSWDWLELGVGIWILVLWKSSVCSYLQSSLSSPYLSLQSSLPLNYNQVPTFFFKNMVSLYTALLTWNLVCTLAEPSCLCICSAGIRGVCYHPRLPFQDRLLTRNSLELVILLSSNHE